MTSRRLAAEPRSWWRRCTRAVWRARYVIVVVSALTTLLHHYHLLDSLESAALDVNIVWGSSSGTQTDTVIVTINDDDYQNEKMFGGRSPLDAEKLKSIIGAILDRHPAVLGVDIVTADAADRTLQAFQNKPVVWVRDASRAGKATWRLDGVLGEKPAPAGVMSGPSLFPRDADGLVRRYYRRLSLPGEDSTRIEESSFAWAILQHYCETRRSQQPKCRRVTELAQERSEEPLWFNLEGDRYTIRRISASAVAADQVPREEFADKIVLFGGTFGAARDTYRTVLGERSGVELTAHAIESELNGGGIRASNHWLMLIMEMFAGVVLVCLNCFWPPESRLNVITTGGGIIALALVGSVVAFHAYGYWASFVPIGVAVWLHEFYDTVEVASHERQELERYRQRYGPL